MYFLSTIYDIRLAISVVAGVYWDLFIIIRTIIAMTLDNKAAKFECLLCYVCGLCNWLRSIGVCVCVCVGPILYTTYNIGKSDASIQINFIFYLRACSLKALNKSVTIGVHNLQYTIHSPHAIQIPTQIYCMNGADSHHSDTSCIYYRSQPIFLLRKWHSNKINVQIDLELP